MSVSVSFPNSNIEFVVIGPERERDSVLIRSENAKLDLIGFARAHRFFSREKSPFFSLIPTRETKLQSVRVDAMEYRLAGDFFSDKHPDKQEVGRSPRSSSLIFAWVGECTSRQRDEIESAFGNFASDIYKPFYNRELREPSIEDTIILSADLELSMSPLIYMCVRAQKKAEFRRKFLYGFLAVYFLTAIIGTFYKSIINFFV